MPNFFATFIEVLTDRATTSIDVEEGVTSGDFLQGFLLGTREALTEKDRPSITITTLEVTEESVADLEARLGWHSAEPAAVAATVRKHAPLAAAPLIEAILTAVAGGRASRGCFVSPGPEARP